MTQTIFLLTSFIVFSYMIMLYIDIQKRSFLTIFMDILGQYEGYNLDEQFVLFPLNRRKTIISLISNSAQLSGFVIDQKKTCLPFVQTILNDVYFTKDMEISERSCKSIDANFSILQHICSYKISQLSKKAINIPF